MAIRESLKLISLLSVGDAFETHFESILIIEFESLGVRVRGKKINEFVVSGQ